MTTNGVQRARCGNVKPVNRLPASPYGHPRRVGTSGRLMDWTPPAGR
jgi:hypothetical protein